jgi:hypothetical protein
VAVDTQASRGWQTAALADLAADDSLSVEAAGEEAAAAAPAPPPRDSGRKRRSTRDADAPAPAVAPLAATRAKQRKVTRPGRAAITASQPALEAAGEAPPQPQPQRVSRHAPAPASLPADLPARPASGARPRTAAPRPVFAVCGLHTADANAAVSALRRLGATAAGGAGAHRWRTGTTHVLEPELRRSARTLAGLASGAWLLDARYAAECAAAGRLLPEAPFELVTCPTGRVARRAPAHWRRRAAATGGGAFAGLTAAVLPLPAPGPTKDDVEAILTAGGALLVDAAAAAREGADFVVAPPNAAARDGRTAALRRGRVPLVTSAYGVEWLAQPTRELGEYVLFGREVGERLAAAAKGRAEG